MLEQLKMLAEDFAKQTINVDPNFEADNKYLLKDSEVKFQCSFKRKGKYDNIVLNDFDICIQKQDGEFIFKLIHGKDYDSKDIEKQIERKVSRFVESYKTLSKTSG